jgi:N-acetylglucosamine malate deacetylase 1
MKVLIIAPHPDDEVLGCGGTMAKYSARGDEVYLCIVTKAYTPDWSEEFIKNRPKEVKESGAILGVKKIYFLDLPTVKLDTIPQKELNGALAGVINEIAPDVVYIPSKGDLHKDHRLVFESALVAARPVGGRAMKILSYETLSETEYGGAVNQFIPNFYEDISQTFQKKLEAMKVYKSELKLYPNPRSLEIMEVLAKKRGSEASLELAEAFMLIREISI